MKTQGDTKRPRCVKAQFDPEFSATPLGGAVLVEKTMRSLRLRRIIGEHLPARSEDAQYSMTDGAYALMAAMIVGGRGIAAADCLRQDDLAREIFGLEKGAPSPPTTYRILCDMSGLTERRAIDVYAPSGPRLPAMDLFGEPREVPKTRRIVPEEPEAAKPDSLDKQRKFLAALARRCHKALPARHSRLHGWWVAFGDATDVEVEGNCFDAAREGRHGERIIRWMTLMLGPLTVAQELVAGNRDEGVAMPGLLKGAQETIGEMVGREGKVLGLFDAAYYEKQVTDLLSEMGWDFIVCANQQRSALQHIAQGAMPEQWSATGPDAARGWAESQVGCFDHWPEGWVKPVTIVARRWREEGELPGTWHYSFLATRIDRGQLPAKLAKRYCSSIWMLYGTKQGRENHYKTPLRDEGLHHPPSCRLGVDQAFYTLGAAASNVAMVLRYAVVEKSERGIELWRLRERYFRIAGYLVRTANTLTVRLSGICVDALRQTLWQSAFAAAGRL